ncbi:unnamed protein product [Caenorhabditis brenneri]
MGLLTSEKKILNISSPRLPEQKYSNAGVSPYTKQQTNGNFNIPHISDSFCGETRVSISPSPPQSEFTPYSEQQLAEIKQLLAVKSRHSQNKIDQLQKDMKAEMEEMKEDFKKCTLQKEEEIMYLKEDIKQRDHQIANLYSIIHVNTEKGAVHYDIKMKGMEEKLEEAARIQKESDRRHQEDQKEKEELLKKIDQLQTNQQMFRLLTTQCFNEHDDEPTTSNPITEAIEKVRMQLMKQTKTGLKRQSDNIDDSTKKKKTRKDNDEGAAFF